MIVIGTDLTSQHREIIPKSKISGIFVEYRKDLYSKILTINIQSLRPVTKLLYSFKHEFNVYTSRVMNHSNVLSVKLKQKRISTKKMGSKTSKNLNNNHRIEERTLSSTIICDDAPYESVNLKKRKL